VSSLSDLTIIIFTYNRHRYVLRNLELWSNTKATVHILDGTDEPLSGELLADFTPNIKYHHLPVSIWDRISRGADMVVTKYVAFLADDEFFIPSAVEASISELDKNQELVACCGRWIDKCLTAELIVSEGAIEGNKLNYERGSSGAVEHDDSIERMICHMNPYVPSAFYAVCRSAEWKKAVGAFTKRQFSSGLVAELQFELSMSFFGKIKVIDELMWLRTAENPSNTEGFELEFHSWFTNALYAQEVDDFLSMTARDMVGAGPQDFHSVREGLARACLAYVAYCAGNDVSGRSGQTTSITKARAVSKGSVLLKRTIKKISSRLPSPLTALLPVRLRFRPYVEIAKGLESLGLRVDWNQLFIILETVKKSHVATS
jgi:glycosyltransferase domain-containing protein